MLELPCASLFQIFSAMFLPNIIWIGFQCRKLSQKLFIVSDVTKMGRTWRRVW